MAKEPALDSKTRLSSALSPEQRLFLARAFLADKADQVRSVAGVTPYVVHTPPDAGPRLAAALDGGLAFLPQRGEDLGARVAYAFDDLFARGHPGVLLVDSDSPTLPTEGLIDGVAALAASDLVLGPAEDGGYYLVGLRRPAPELFRGVPWSTARALDVTIQRAKGLGLLFTLLLRWYDVDRPEDLTRLASELENAPSAARRTAALLRAMPR